MTQAVKRLYEAGSRDIAFALCADLAASLTDAAHLDAWANSSPIRAIPARF